MRQGLRQKREFEDTQKDAYR
nr:unnamed protein product [Callosobruchus analis]